MSIRKVGSLFLALVLVMSMFMSAALPMAFAEGDSWETKADMPTARSCLTAVEVNGKIYAIGGKNSSGETLDAVEEYDPVTDSWATKACMPTARYNLGAAEVDGKIYAIGGYGTSAVEQYDPATDKWSTKTSMPTAQSYVVAVEVNGKIYAIGVDRVQIYDPKTDTWTKWILSMGFDKSEFAVAEVDGKAYVFGGWGTDDGKSYGYDERIRILKFADGGTYSPSSPEFTNKGMGAAEVYGEIYIIGSSTTNKMYDPNTNSFMSKTSMPTGRSNLAVVEVDGIIYAIGGSYLNTVEAYTPATITPEAPTNLTATAGDSQVSLSWDSVPNAAYYNVQRSTTSGGTYEIIAENLTDTSYVDTDVTNGTTYYYIVRAVNTAGVSENSNEASATPQESSLSAPTNLTATAGNEQVSLSWDSDSVSGAVYGYNVKRSTTSGEPYDVIAEGVDDTSYIDKDVSNGTTYYYVVSATNDEGESQNSNEASATPQSSGSGGYDGDYNLVIYLVSGLVREYEVSGDELEDFMDWCEDNETGTGLTMFEFEKDSDLGAYDSRTDYIVFDKMMMFEVNEY